MIKLSQYLNTHLVNWEICMMHLHNKHLRSLESLGEQVDSWDRLILYILAQKFDEVTRRDWESYPCEGELPTMNDMHKFLKNAKFLEN